MRPLLALLIVVAAAMAACQTYESRPHEAQAPAKDAKPAREAAGRDAASAEASPGRDAATESAPAAESGPSPDRCSTPASCPVLFSYDKGSESKVELYGSFNAWSAGVPMTLAGSVWQATLTLDDGQQVQYKFVLDGTTWVKDPKNPTDSGAPDHNSVLDVVCPPTCP